MQSLKFHLPEPSTNSLKIPSESMAKSMDEGRSAFFRVRESIRNMIMMEMKDKASLITNIKKRDVESPKSSMCSHICDIFIYIKLIFGRLRQFFFPSSLFCLPSPSVCKYTYLCVFFTSRICNLLNRSTTVLLCFPKSFGAACELTRERLRLGL